MVSSAWQPQQNGLKKKYSGNTGKGKDSGSSSQEYKETIDWAEKTMTLLTNKLNLLNAKLD